jgi:hypothetical protein
MALPLALGVMLALTASVTAVIQFASASSRSASYSLSDQNARAIAEDGLNRAAAIVAADPDRTTPVVGSASGYPQGGSVSWTGTKSGGLWTVTSVSSVPNPTGPDTAPLSHTVEAGFEEAFDTTPWNFVFVRPTPGTCLTFSNTFVMESPLYVDGNFCLQNSARYAGPRLYVKGTLTTANTATVGTAAARIPRVSVQNFSPSPSGCGYTSSLATPATFTLPCGDAHNVFATAFDTVVPAVPKPTFDLNAEYAAAAPGSTARNHRCYANSKRDLQAVNGLIGGNWSTARAGAGWAGASAWIDNNTMRDASLGVFNLMPRDVSYKCEVRDAYGMLLSSLAWTYGEPGALQISGAVYLDGDVRIAQTNGVVDGSGWIYATRRITIEQQATLCGVPDCGSSWDPNMEPAHLVFLVSGHTGSGTNNWAVEVQNSAKFQGGLYATGGMFIGQSGMVHGPAVADQFEAHNTADFNPWPWLAILPDGAPATSATVFRMNPGSWRG